MRICGSCKKPVMRPVLSGSGNMLCTNCGAVLVRLVDHGVREATNGNGNEANDEGAKVHGNLAVGT